MTVKTKKEKLGFQTEVQQLLKLMVHSLYSNKEIFLRELISNASDAADKLRFEALQDDKLFEDDPELNIRVEFNKDKKTITVLDNGIGMSRDEVIENLGTIARSGTKHFFEKLTGDQSKDSSLIGQFGVGFYSSFIVANKVEVVTRRAGTDKSQGVRWISTGESDYTIETVNRPRKGTKVTLHLRDDAEDFLDGYKLRSIIKRYSDHISIPIQMDKEGEEKGDETVNSAKALWARNKKEITDEEYNEFYKNIAHDYENPLSFVHSKVEGKLEYTSLLFIPARAPFDLWDRDNRHGVKLYVRRVFIMDDADQLLPPYLRFVRGIVDSDDLPLNISREILQKNKTIDSIRSGITKKILDQLGTLADKEPDNYKTLWKEFGRVLKEGVVDDTSDKKEDLAKLFRFSSTHEESDEQTVALADYVSRMKEGQNEIFYLTAENLTTARNSPHLEIFLQKNIEVLLLTDPIDEWVSTHLPEFDGKQFKSIMKGELDLGDLDSDAKDKKEKKDKKVDETQEKMIKNIQKALGEQVKDVRITGRLTNSPACLVSETDDMGRQLQQILKASGQSLPETKPILEINPDHPLVLMLEEKLEDKRFDDWSHILFDQALLSEGGKLSDPAGFVKRLNAIFMEMGELQDKDPQK
ncbi:MAG: molecular chaperone HtpG [Gammaproteobacteria bacterium]|jgi:molecular chaperone HtpG